MTSEILYRKLQEHLDRMPIPFPRTESGVEIRILQMLFTPEDAEMALELSALPEPAATIHKRLDGRFTVPEVARRLDDMADRGLIMKLPGKDGALYAKSVFVVGIYEHQLKRLTPELESASREYMREAFGHIFPAGKTKQMRTVPVNRSIPIVRQVATYEDIRGYVESCEGPFAKAECICRHGKEILGEKCKQTSTLENCLTIGIGATSMVESKIASYISREEMLALLDAAEEEGLVLQPQNTKNPLFVCCCCGCCCGVLTSAKQLPRPADHFNTNFTMEADAEKCEACGVCETRCPMDALSRNGDGKTQVDESRCIGCALCMTKCPSGALQLKPRAVSSVPPDNTMALYGKILHERFGPLGMAKLGARKVLGLKI